MKNFRAPIAVVAFVMSLFVAARWGAYAGLAFFAACAAIMAPRESVAFANNFGILNNTILVFDAFSQFLENLLPVTNFVLDVQDPNTGVREAKPGDTITVKDWRSAVTVYNPTTAGGGYNTLSNANIAAKDKQLTLPNAPVAVSIALTPEEYRILESGVTKGIGYTTFREKLANLMRDGLGKQAITDWFAVISSANYPTNFDTAVGTFGRATEIDLEAKLFGRNVPTDGAQIICPPSVRGELTKDHVVIQTYTGQSPKGLLIDGGWQSDTTSFKFWRTNRPMPAEAPRGFATTKTAVIAAFRIPYEATYEADPVSLNQLVDPKTGIPMLARLWKNSQTGVIQLDLAAIWVFAPGQAEAIERLTIPA